MPVYDYQCKHCGTIEISHGIKEQDHQICPECGKKGLKKLISSVGGIIMKGKQMNQYSEVKYAKYWKDEQGNRHKVTPADGHAKSITPPKANKMRYIKLKTITTKVADEIVDEEEYVFKILETLMSKELSFTLRLKDGLKRSPVRIMSLTNQDFKFRLMGANSSLISSASLDEIDYLEINTQDTLIANKKPNVSRWSLLDPTSFDDS